MSFEGGGDLGSGSELRSKAVRNSLHGAGRIMPCENLRLLTQSAFSRGYAFFACLVWNLSAHCMHRFGCTELSVACGGSPRS